MGARLFHIFYEEPSYYWQHPARVFFIWQGGFVWYGGCLTALGAGWLWCRSTKISFLAWSDFFSPMAAVGYGLGRIACFLNGCCYGKVCSWPWAVRFKSHMDLGLPILPRHPTQLYMAFAEFMIAGILLYFESRWRRDRGRLFFSWLGMHGLARLVIGFWRDDYSGPLLGPLNVAGAVSILLLMTSGLWFLRHRSQANSLFRFFRDRL
jgi:phosphatidylglycerol:prolipoprotein diacylglycerol transferase